MCGPASFVLTEDRVYWSRRSDNHEDIIEEFELTDDISAPTILRVEVVPPDGDMTKPLSDMTKPLSEWIYQTDQDLLPAWSDPVNDERRTRRALKNWAEVKLVLEGRREIKESQLYAWNNATVEARGDATIEARGDVTIEARGDVMIEAWDDVTIKARNNVTVEAYGRVVVMAYDNTAVKARVKATVIKWDKDVKFILSDGAACIDRSGPKIRFFTAGGENNGT